MCALGCGGEDAQQTYDNDAPQLPPGVNIPRIRRPERVAPHREFAHLHRPIHVPVVEPSQLRRRLLESGRRHFREVCLLHLGHQTRRVLQGIAGPRLHATKRVGRLHQEVPRLFVVPLQLAKVAEHVREDRIIHVAHKVVQVRHRHVAQKTRGFVAHKRLDLVLVQVLGRRAHRPERALVHVEQIRGVDVPGKRPERLHPRPAPLVRRPPRLLGLADEPRRLVSGPIGLGPEGPRDVLKRIPGHFVDVRRVEVLDEVLSKVHAHVADVLGKITTALGVALEAGRKLGALTRADAHLTELGHHVHDTAAVIHVGHVSTK